MSGMAIEFSLAVPTLITHDLEKTAAFYMEKLGFEINYGKASGTFCSFRRDEAFVHYATSRLEPRPNRNGWLESVKPADASFFVNDVKALHEEFVSRDVDIHCPPRQ
jgi:catechol 2,3-dioxygenase-like lactoylglutathione lyase family enzyme